MAVAQTLLPPGAATFDTNAGFSAAGYTVKVAGYYQVSALAQLNAIPSANGPSMQVQRNGTSVTAVSFTNNFTAGWNMPLVLSDVVSAVVNDVLRVTVGGAGSGTAGGTNSFLSLSRVGGT